MNRPKLEEQLTRFGFLPTHAKLYLAGLQLGPALMAHLALKANLKRSTCYYILPELLRRGFFAKKKIGKRFYYITASPERLLAMTKERARSIHKLLPELKKTGFPPSRE